MAATVTPTHTVTTTGTYSHTAILTETGTGSASWTGTLTSTATTTQSAAVKDNPIIGAVGTGTGTNTLYSDSTYLYFKTGTATSTASLAVISQNPKIGYDIDGALGSIYTNPKPYMSGEKDLGSSGVRWGTVYSGALNSLDIATASATSKIVRAKTDGKIDSSWFPSGTVAIAWSTENLTTSYVSVSDSAWTDIMSKSLSTAAVGFIATANASIYCTTVNRDAQIRLTLDGSAVSPAPKVTVDQLGSFFHLSVSGAGSFAAGTHTLRLQAYANGTNCRVYGGSTDTGLTVQQL